MVAVFVEKFLLLKMNQKNKLKIVLAGQANVGKSVIFNYLTGLHQHIGNWPGKTVEKAEGELHYQKRSIKVIDLPGIYSLTSYSIEEQISREYILFQKPDFIINVSDVTNLERNLLFTLQLLELEKPMVLALNMSNLLKEKGITIEFEKLKKILGIPVIPVEAIFGKGITNCLDEGIRLTTNKMFQPKRLSFGKEVEEELQRLAPFLEKISLPYPKRWLAIKLLEKDKKIANEIYEKNPEIKNEVRISILRLEKLHGHDSAITIASERCFLVSEIIKKVLKITRPAKLSFNEKLDRITGSRIWGYPVLVGVLTIMFFTIFNFGNWLTSLIENLTSGWAVGWQNLFGNSLISSLAWAGIEGVIALLSLAIPYVVPFYLFLFFLEDLGYLARVAFLLDNLMHKLGVHGKACVPLLLGFGCNVPACLSCRIMETNRERLITGILTVFIPCSAVTVIILGLVGKFVGAAAVLGLYLLNLIIIFILGKLMTKIMPGETTELIMEIPEYRKPHLKTIFYQTWFRVKEFFFIAAPLVIISGIIIKAVEAVGWLSIVADLLSPITVSWLGLPKITGILLIFGILRKELILVMLATVLGTVNFASVLSSTQMITLSTVSMFYIPCVATMAAFNKEFGWKKTLVVTLLKIAIALILGGIIYRFLTY